MHFVVAYDIVQDRRRNKVMNVLKNVGLRVQYSVFECDLTMSAASDLFRRLEELANPRSDRIHMYALCDTCFFRSQSVGSQIKPRWETV